VQQADLATIAPRNDERSRASHHVVSYFGSFGVICYDLNGKEIWKYEMPTAWTHGRYGSSTSPIIAKGTVCLIRDDRVNARLIALDVTNGNLRWESARPEARGGYGTPIVWDDQIIVSGSVQLNSYDLDSGKQRWLVDGLSPVSCHHASARERPPLPGRLVSWRIRFAEGAVVRISSQARQERRQQNR